MTEPLVDHPAKFTPSILDAIRAEIQANLLVNPTVLDPFVGVGGIYDLVDIANVIGVEIEPEWAATHPATVCGDSTNLAELLPDLVGNVDVIATSPAYANRFADQYLGSDDEKCRKCMGTGHRGFQSEGAPVNPNNECQKCGGTGKAKSKRAGYAISLGRRTSDNSGAGMAWGARYKALHAAVWDQCALMIRPGGLWLINISSFIKADEYQGVMEWHLGEIARRATVERLVPIPTPRMSFGANGDSRVPVEHLIVARAA